jgi:hypothetical protein
MRARVCVCSKIKQEAAGITIYQDLSTK